MPPPFRDANRNAALKGSSRNKYFQIGRESRCIKLLNEPITTDISNADDILCLFPHSPTSQKPIIATDKCSGKTARAADRPSSLSCPSQTNIHVIKYAVSSRVSKSSFEYRSSRYPNQTSLPLINLLRDIKAL